MCTGVEPEIIGALAGAGEGGAALGTGLIAGAGGLGLTASAGEGLGLASTASGLGMTTGSAGAGSIGAGLGTSLGGLGALDAAGTFSPYGTGSTLSTASGGTSSLGSMFAPSTISSLTPEVSTAINNFSNGATTLNAASPDLSQGMRTLTSGDNYNSALTPRVGLPVPADTFESIGSNVPTNPMGTLGTSGEDLNASSFGASSPYSLGSPTGNGVGMTATPGQGTTLGVGGGGTGLTQGMAETANPFWQGASSTPSGTSGLGSLFGAGINAIKNNPLAAAQLGMKGLSSVYDLNAKKQLGNQQMDRFNQLNQSIENSYAPGSPEYQAMEHQLAAADAKAGRNSQYGQRAVELQARIAAIKAQQRAQLQMGQNQIQTAGLNNQYGGLNSMFFNAGSATPLGGTPALVVR